MPFKQKVVDLYWIILTLGDVIKTLLSSPTLPEAQDFSSKFRTFSPSIGGLMDNNTLKESQNFTDRKFFFSRLGNQSGLLL